MTGLLYWSTTRATVGLVITDDIVTACAPYARRWALGKTLAELRILYRERGDVTAVWVSDA